MFLLIILKSLATSYLPFFSIAILKNWTCSQLKLPKISQTFMRSLDKVYESTILRFREGVDVVDMYF